VDFLEQVVFDEIRRLTKFACHYEEEFVKVVSDYSKQMLSTQLAINQTALFHLLYLMVTPLLSGMMAK